MEVRTPTNEKTLEEIIAQQKELEQWAKLPVNGCKEHALIYDEACYSCSVIRLIKGYN